MNDGPAVTVSRLTGLTQKDVARDDASLYTTNFGQILPDSAHSLDVGGIPTTIDTALFEKQQTFNRSKTRERIVHPCGSAAFGSFTVAHDVSKYTKADFLQPGTVTPVFTRFSTVTYGREHPDQARNPRGFAVKFYTASGYYDLVGMNWPSFFVREPFMGPDVIRSQQRNPRNFLIDYNAWRLGALLLSDEGTPVGWKQMNGFGCHTFRWTNKEGGSVFVKYHWICQQEKKNFSYDEAVRMCGEDPDYAERDLWEYIENGNAARWTMKVQLMTPEEATSVDFDPFDVTKFWPESQFPLVEVGELKLDSNPENYHRDVEQAAFSPGSLVPGIELSPDSLLCWRAWFYRDTQYDRLGSANIHQIPVNCPFMAKQHSPDNYAGNMRVDGNTLSKPVYMSYLLPRSGAPTTDTTPSFDVTAVETPMQVASNVLSRMGHYCHEGHPSEYWANLHSNTGRLLKFADEIVKKNYLIQLYASSPAYANGVYKGLPEKPKTFTMDEVAEASKTAHLDGKNPQFQLKNAGAQFMGMGIPASSQYAMDSTPDKQ
ncbi:hypothetical protein JCM10296v2_001758 [Rhodotorula toruloides]